MLTHTPRYEGGTMAPLLGFVSGCVRETSVSVVYGETFLSREVNKYSLFFPHLSVFSF